MDSSNRSSIPALSASSSKQSNNNSSSDSMFLHSDSSHRYGLFSTAKKSTSSVNRSKYSNCYSAVTSKPGSKGLFSQTPETDRVSLYSASASGRRSSIASERNRQRDFRALAHPRYQQNVINRLIPFLAENGYSSPIPYEFVKSPSIQDVTRVFEFLFAQIDPSSVVSPIERNVPELMVQLGYPYYISKSTLVVAGRHELGNLLGMFEFLVDLARLFKDDHKDEEKIICSPFTTDDAFIKKSVKKIISENHEDLTPAFEELAFKIYGDLDGENDRLIKDLKEDRAMIEKIDADNFSIEELQMKNDQYEKAIAEYKIYNSNMEARNLKDAEEIAAEEEEIAALRENDREFGEEIADLEKIIKEQPYSVADMQAEEDKQAQIEKDISETRQNSRKTKPKIYQLDSGISSLQTSIIKATSNFVSSIKTGIMNLNSPLIKNNAPWIIEKVQSVEFQEILDLLSKPDMENIVETTKTANKLINEFSNIIIETSVGLSAKLARTNEKNKQHISIAAEKEKELEQLQEQLSNAEKNLREFKKQCEIERKLLIEGNEELKKMVEEESISLAETEKECKECLHQEEQLLKQEDEEMRKMVEHEEMEIKKRQEMMDKVILGYYTVLKKIEEIESREVAELEEKVAGAKATRKRLQQDMAKSESGSTGSFSQTPEADRSSLNEASNDSMGDEEMRQVILQMIMEHNKRIADKQQTQEGC